MSYWCVWPCSVRRRPPLLRYSSSRCGLRSISRTGRPARARRAAQSMPRLPAPRMCQVIIVSDGLLQSQRNDAPGGVGVTQQRTGLAGHVWRVGWQRLGIDADEADPGLQRDEAFAGLEGFQVEALVQTLEAAGRAG